MALRKIIDIEGNSIVHTNFGNVENGTQRVSFSAYIKVVRINGDKIQMTADVLFAGEIAKLHKQYTIPVSVGPGASNFIAQAYEHLKTLPEFAGAIDC